MGKRSSYPRRERELYPTPRSAVPFLVRHLVPGFGFVEPCAADHGLADYLIEAGGTCLACYDIEPLHPAVERRDALTLTRADVPPGASLITNLPFGPRSLMHGLIDHLAALAPLWTLMELDWFATAQATPFADRLHVVQCLPRLKLIAGSPYTGMSNHAWALFRADRPRHGTRFFLQPEATP
jgi:hypothetical protein